MELVPVDLNKLSGVVKSDVVKKALYDELVKTVNAIQTTDFRELIKKSYYETKIGETEKKIADHDQCNKYITTHEFNKLAADIFAVRLKQANLTSKNDIADFVKRHILVKN